MSIVRFSVKTGGSDDGDASQDSFASYASSCADLESSASLSSLAHHFESTEKTSRASAKGKYCFLPMYYDNSCLDPIDALLMENTNSVMLARTVLPRTFP